MWWIHSWVHRNPENPSPASSISYPTISPVTPCFPTELPVSCTFSCVSQSEASTCDQDFHFNVFVHIHPWLAWRYGHYIFKKKRKHTHTNQKHCSLVALLIREMYLWIESILLKLKALRHTTKRTHTHTIPGSNCDILKTRTLTWTTKMWIG